MIDDYKTCGEPPCPVELAERQRVEIQACLTWLEEAADALRRHTDMNGRMEKIQDVINASISLTAARKGEVPT